MNIETTPIQGLFLTHTMPRQDQRGSFTRLFDSEALKAVLGHRKIIHINLSVTAQTGAIRGLHYQRAPHAEMKLIRCLRGAVHDVAVDLRPDSPTYLQHHAIRLEAGDGKMFVLPEGFAHGFQTLTDGAELLYLHTHAYAPSSEAGIRYNDPALGITWPAQCVDLSDRDKLHPFISERNAPLF